MTVEGFYHAVPGKDNESLAENYCVTEEKPKPLKLFIKKTKHAIKTDACEPITIYSIPKDFQKFRLFIASLIRHHHATRKSNYNALYFIFELPFINVPWRLRETNSSNLEITPIKFN